MIKGVVNWDELALIIKFPIQNTLSHNTRAV
jgi:hypothetical protein